MTNKVDAEQVCSGLANDGAATVQGIRPRIFIDCFDDLSFFSGEYSADADAVFVAGSYGFGPCFQIGHFFRNFLANLVVPRPFFRRGWAADALTNLARSSQGPDVPERE